MNHPGACQATAERCPGNVRAAAAQLLGNVQAMSTNSVSPCPRPVHELAVAATYP
jgi:hypothetical protein